jgi:ketosteroid isomerase-like protein
VSQENLELLRRALGAYERGDMDTALQYCDRDIEYITVGVLDVAPLYKGHDALRELTSLWAEQFDGFHHDAQRIIDVDDRRVLVLFTRRGLIRDSQDWAEGPLGTVVEIRDGKLTRIKAYVSWDDALKAVGLDE